jgi:hypothetical protein
VEKKVTNARSRSVAQDAEEGMDDDEWARITGSASTDVFAKGASKGKGKGYLALENGGDSEGWNKSKGKGKGKEVTQLTPAEQLANGIKKMAQMIKMLTTLKTKLNAAAFEMRHDKKKQQDIVKAVALMAQQSLILTELQKEDPGNPAMNCFIV